MRTITNGFVLRIGNITCSDARGVRSEAIEKRRIENRARTARSFLFRNNKNRKRENVTATILYI